MGCWSSGVAKVLSIIEIKLCFFANFAAFSTSTRRTGGCGGLSTYKTRVREFTSVSVPARSVPTRTPTPCLCPWTACTALVCEPRKRLLVREVVEEFLARREIVVFIVLSFWSRVRPRQAPIWADSQRSGRCLANAEHTRQGGA